MKVRIESVAPADWQGGIAVAGYAELKMLKIGEEQMELISTYDIPVKEQHIKDGWSRNQGPKVSPLYPPGPIQLAFADHFQEHRETSEYVDHDDILPGKQEVGIREFSIHLLNPNKYVRNEQNMIKIAADESVIEWVKKFYSTKKGERADNIPPITIRATINHRTGEGVMTICEYSNTRRPIGF